MNRPPSQCGPRVAVRSGSGLSLEQVADLTRQQQRILHRSTVLDRVLATDTLVGAADETRTLRDALIELLADITAAYTIGTILPRAKAPSA